MRSRIIALLLSLSASLVSGCGGGDDPVIEGADDAAETSTTDSTTTTTTTASGQTSTTSAADRPADLTVWPAPASSVRYDDPVKAARAFAVELVGFRRPVLGTYRAGDSRSGEVELRAGSRGPVTTVSVRRFGPDDSWWVVGSTTSNIALQSPTAGATVSSPLRLTGRARAFEGTVQVELREHGEDDPVATGFVTGSGGGELGPFDGEFEFRRQPKQSSRGVLLLFTESAETGDRQEVAAIPVGFSGG